MQVTPVTPSYTPVTQKCNRVLPAPSAVISIYKTSSYILFRLHITYMRACTRAYRKDICNLKKCNRDFEGSFSRLARQKPGYIFFVTESLEAC
jgi:hypothetical protein